LRLGDSCASFRTSKTAAATGGQTPNQKETTMSRKHNDQSYIESEEERERGHVDTREKNFECENKTSIGCDPGIDVAG